MKKLLILAGCALSLACGTATAEAKSKHHKHHYRGHDHHDNVYVEHGSRGRSRTIYVIERNRPVQRVVYLDGDGRYYRYSGGRRVYVRERYYTSYPSRYYYPDGRPRVGVSIRF